MIIRTTCPLDRVVAALRHAIDQSRFTATIELDASRRQRDQIKVVMIRLRTSKLYCGNHPGPCLGPLRPRRRSACLEGLDWIEWDDLVNDVLDRLGAEADVWSQDSGRMWIRRGRRRRVRYGQRVFLAHGRWHADWESGQRLTDFEDWIGRQAPRSQYPIGTPGGRPCESVPAAS